MPRPSPIAKRIMRALGERNVKTADFARQTNIDASYFSHLASGKIQQPSPDRLQQIAEALGVPIISLMDPAPTPAVDADLVQRLSTALGTDKSHLFESAFEALKELPPTERERAIEVIHALATNWPSHRP